MVNILKGIKDKKTYFKTEDFENMFLSYDIFEDKGSKEIPFTYLIQAL